MRFESGGNRPGDDAIYEGSEDELHETELEYLNAMFDSGSEIAVPAAIYYCSTYNLALPKWLGRASAKMGCGLPLGNTPKRGAYSRVFSRYRKDMDHYNRWCAVDEVLEARKFLQTEIEGCEDHPGLKELPGSKARERLKQVREKLKELGTAQQDAFEFASERLGGTETKNGADAVKKSYDKVERALTEARNCGNSMMNYHVLPSDFLRIFGTIQEAKKVKVRK